MRTYESNFATVDEKNKSIVLYNDMPYNGMDFILLKDAKILIFEGELRIDGLEIQYGFCFSRTYLSDLKHVPEHKFIKTGYRTIKDFFNGVKSQYVQGWYRIQETKKYRCHMHKWSLRLQDHENK